jgi:multidrug efflux system membrane fusion protein
MHTSTHFVKKSAVAPLHGCQPEAGRDGSPSRTGRESCATFEILYNLKHIRITTACLACLAAAVLTGCSATAPVAATGPPVAPVTVATVVQRTAPIDVQVIGNVEAYETVSVKSQIGGILEHVSIHEGDFVKKGDLLFTIDRRPLEAQVKQTEANLAHDRAALRQAEANLRRDMAQENFARSQAQRYQQLFERKAVSKQEAEQYSTDADMKHEVVAADQAAIETAKAADAADQAALDNAKVQLSYTEIHSPVDGRLGNLNVKEGNVVKSNDIEMISINRLQPIYVTFAIPEDRLAEVRKQNAAGLPPDDLRWRSSGTRRHSPSQPPRARWRGAPGAPSSAGAVR